MRLCKSFIANRQSQPNKGSGAAAKDCQAYITSVVRRQVEPCVVNLSVVRAKQDKERAITAPTAEEPMPTVA